MCTQNWRFWGFRRRYTTMTHIVVNSFAPLQGKWQDVEQPWCKLSGAAKTEKMRSMYDRCASMQLRSCHAHKALRKPVALLREIQCFVTRAEAVMASSNNLNSSASRQAWLRNEVWLLANISNFALHLQAHSSRVYSYADEKQHSLTPSTNSVQIQRRRGEAQHGAQRQIPASAGQGPGCERGGAPAALPLAPAAAAAAA